MTKPVFKAFKVKVANAHQSEAVQTWAFAQGYGWQAGERHELKYLSAAYLFFSNHGEIMYGTTEQYFNVDSRPERVFEFKVTAEPAKVMVKLGDEVVSAEDALNLVKARVHMIDDALYTSEEAIKYLEELL